ncbi:MAG: hypothetical protein PHW32_04365 [Bacilli bacterium]|nr:hypothetical protein [Bacilli bacterium]MDD4282991.1 hypothetical protein [Bacilli bacterium]
MEEINYTRDELNKLEIFNKGGFEGRILVYSDQLLIKAFEPYLKEILDFENKKLKIIRLNEKNINGMVLVKPQTLVNVDGKFEGYVMQKINEGKTIDSFHDFKILLNLYQKLFEKMEIIHDNNIIIGDVKHANIVVEELEPVFIDVDSMAVDELEMDHKQLITGLTKTIPNIYNKYKNNDEKEIDKLKLLSCFIHSINQNRGTIYQRLTESDLSQTFKNEAVKILETDYNLNVSKNIHQLFEDELRKAR